jgi:hypothetical protein
MKRLAIVFLLLATTMQAFVAQTHVHAGPAAAPAEQVLFVAEAATGNEQLPAGGDHGTCLLCQIASHGAAALAPQVFELLQPALVPHVAAHGYAPDPASLPLSHAWSSRGPPRS